MKNSKTQQIESIVKTATSISEMKSKIEALGVKWVSLFIEGKNGLNPKFCAKEDCKGFCKVGLSSKTIGFYFDASLVNN